MKEFLHCHSSFGFILCTVKLLLLEQLILKLILFQNPKNSYLHKHEVNAAGCWRGASSVTHFITLEDKLMLLLQSVKLFVLYIRKCKVVLFAGSGIINFITGLMLGIPKKFRSKISCV